MRQEDKPSEGRVTRKRSGVITKSIRGSLEVRSVGLFNNCKGKVPMLPRQAALRCSTRGRRQNLLPMSGIRPRRFSEPETCASNSRSPLERYQATRKVRPSADVTSELGRF
jgi:hypothetical protein